MQAVRFLSTLAVAALVSSVALAQTTGGGGSGGVGEAKLPAQAPAAPAVPAVPASPPMAAPVPSLCVPGTLIEAFSEGAWYTAVVLDPLRDGRCFVHYDNYDEDDDEALAPKYIRARR